MDYSDAFAVDPEPPPSDDSDADGPQPEPEEDAELSQLFGAMLTCHADDIPNSYSEAMKSSARKEWQSAAKEEYDSLVRNDVFDLVPLPNRKKLIQNRWVFSIKRDRKGNILRHKGRLVAKGFTQRKGIDYNQTFAPVVRFESLRMLLALAAHDRMDMTQFDVKTAFLNGTIEEEIYMSQPEGFEDGTGRVWRLKKGLYGLKQSPRA